MRTDPRLETNTHTTQVEQSEEDVVIARRIAVKSSCRRPALQPSTRNIQADAKAALVSVPRAASAVRRKKGLGIEHDGRLQALPPGNLRRIHSQTKKFLQSDETPAYFNPNSSLRGRRAGQPTKIEDCKDFLALLQVRDAICNPVCGGRSAFPVGYGKRAVAFVRHDPHVYEH